MRTQPLKVCDRCGKNAEHQGGVVMRGKWVCARCWVRWTSTK